MTRWLALLPDFYTEWASRRLELAQEIAADQLAARRFPGDLARYAELLITMVNQPQSNRILPGLAAGAAGQYQTLRTRIVAMKSFHQTSRRAVIASAVLLCVVAALGIVPWRLVAAEAAEPVADQPPGQIDAVQFTPVQEQILQRLKEPVRWEFTETPLRQVVRYVKDMHKIDLQLDEEAVGEAGIADDTPVTFHIRSINLNNALWLMLRDHGLTHVIRRDALLITTSQQAKQIVKEGGINPDGVKLWAGNGEILRTLAEPTTLEFLETPLQWVIDYLADLYSIPIHLDRQAIREAKLGTNTPVTLNIHSVALNSGLRLMLNEIGLTHVVSHEVLLITTPKQRDRLVQHGAFEPDDIRFSPSNKWIFPALAEKTRGEFIDTPIQEVADYLQDVHSVLIRLDTRAIRKAGMSTDATVTKKLDDFTLHSALKDILGELGLTHVVQNEVLLITTPEEGRRRLREGAMAPADTNPAVPAYARKSVAAALKTAVTVECREQPLSELVDILKQQCGVEIRIDDWELATVGLTRDVRCTITVKDVPLQSVLKQLLGDVDLGYIAEGGLIVITSRDTSVRHGGQSTPSLLLELLRMEADLEAGPAPHGAVITSISFSNMPRRFTDKVFEDLKVLSWLRKLNLAGTKVTDAGLAHLTSFPRLDTLDLSNTEISDAGLAQLRNVPHLARLSLSGDRITDAGLAHVAALGELQSLTLDCAQVTDAGLAHLKELTSLRRLDLSYTQITDGGIPHLLQWWQNVRAAKATSGDPFARGPTYYGFVTVRGTKITPAAAEELSEKRLRLRLSGVRPPRP